MHKKELPVITNF